MERYAVTPGVGRTLFTPEQMGLISQAAGPDGKVELNAFMQLIIHTSDPDLAGQQQRLRAAGLGIYPVGPVVKNLHTCTFCSGEKAEAMADARRLDEAVAGSPVPFPVRIGFSGCTSNCGEALVRDIGVVPMEPGRYDIYIGGRPGSLTPNFGVKVAEGVPSVALVETVAAILAFYRETAKGKERFWRNVERIGADAYRERLGRLALEA